MPKRRLSLLWAPRARARSSPFRAAGGDRDTEEPAGVRRVAVERVKRVQNRRAEAMELAHQGDASLLQQVASLTGEPDPRPSSEQLAPGRAHLLHDAGPGPGEWEIALSISF